ncbi:MAG: hypothetical protein WCI72_03760 [archaeon]
MAEQQQDNQLQIILSDLGTRMRDIEERTNSIKERMLLINANLIDAKEELEQRVLAIEKQNATITSELKKINSSIQNILSETNNFVRKDEIILVERMLKDFQPLEFVRRKDLEEMKLSKPEQTETYYTPQVEDKIQKKEKITNPKEIKTRETTE